MKLSELISKVVTLDPNKEYEINEGTLPIETTTPHTIITTSSTAEPPKPEPPKPESPPIQQPTQNNDDMAKLQERIKVLEATNVALLNRIPVGEPEKTPEELIYDLCVPSNRRIYNDNTGSRAES